jgi:hypothetical protein
MAAASAVSGFKCDECIRVWKVEVVVTCIIPKENGEKIKSPPRAGSKCDYWVFSR